MQVALGELIDRVAEFKASVNEEWRSFSDAYSQLQDIAMFQSEDWTIRLRLLEACRKGFPEPETPQETLSHDAAWNLALHNLYFCSERWQEAAERYAQTIYCMVRLHRESPFPRNLVWGSTLALYVCAAGASTPHWDYGNVVAELLRLEATGFSSFKILTSPGFTWHGCIDAIRSSATEQVGHRWEKDAANDLGLRILACHVMLSVAEQAMESDADREGSLLLAYVAFSSRGYASLIRLRNQIDVLLDVPARGASHPLNLDDTFDTEQLRNAWQQFLAEAEALFGSCSDVGCWAVCARLSRLRERAVEIGVLEGL